MNLMLYNLFIHIIIILMIVFPFPIVAKAAGLDPDSISDDAEISPELLEALASQKLTPEQIEIVSDGEGRTRIQSRTNSLTGVQEGHLYIAPGRGKCTVQKDAPANLPPPPTPNPHPAQNFIILQDRRRSQQHTWFRLVMF